MVFRHIERPVAQLLRVSYHRLLWPDQGSLLHAGVSEQILFGCRTPTHFSILFILVKRLCHLLFLEVVEDHFCLGSEAYVLVTNG